MQRFSTLLFSFVVLWLGSELSPLLAQPCNQGIALKSLVIGNASCGNKTGFISFQMNDKKEAFTYNWIPNVSDSSSGIDLASGIYRVRIVRKDEPACVIDTLLLVSNSDGPQFTADEVVEPNCKATDGSIRLAPASGLSYNWYSGKTGPILTGLGAGCYIVAATDPVDGCVSYRRICLQSTNRLKSSVEVIKPAKCGRATAEVKLKISGGYGSYTNTCADTSDIVKNLGPGPNVCLVTDEISGCKIQVDFIVPNVLPEGTINPTIYPVRCPGASDGFVVVNVDPGKNFASPFTATLLNALGNNVGFANLPKGPYTLHITDADSCSLPPYFFVINEPDPFVITSAVSPETCGSGGVIDLSVKGGNGKNYLVAWDDLQGQKNGLKRENLSAGRYSATIIDSLFCSARFDTVMVSRKCNTPDTVFGLVVVNKSESFCLPKPIGLDPSTIKYALSNGTNKGASAFGTWELLPNGCLIYDAKSKAGFAVDTICISYKTAFQDLDKSTCIIMSIATSAPERDSIYFTVQANSAATSCGTIPAIFKKPAVSLIDNFGLIGTSGSFGSYSINDTSACITFRAKDLPGFNVDDICVMVYDKNLNQGKVICYFPTILPQVDCSPFQFFTDSIKLVTLDCAFPTNWCAPIPFQKILEYNILDNGLGFQGGIVGCNFKNVFGYQFSGLPQQGPFVMESWDIDGNLIGGGFPDLNTLPILMNTIDPTGNWITLGNLIYGGNATKKYGDIVIRIPNGEKKTFKLESRQLAQNAELELTTGFHRLEFKHINSGCLDTALVDVKCVDCPPVVTYATNTEGVIDWSTSDCAKDTVFCTAIENANDYTILINGKPVPEYEACGNFIGFKLDTGFYQITIRNTVTTCTYETEFFYHCEKVVNDKTVNISMFANQQTQWCMDTSVIASPIVNTYNACPKQSNGNVNWALDINKKCVSLAGNAPGVDTICLRVCNNKGDCANVSLIVTVLAKQDSFLAVPDKSTTIRNTPTDVNILKNDVFNGQVQVVVTTMPTIGNITFNPASGIMTYTPDPDLCGFDSLIYEIRDLLGRSSAAKVSIEILCDKILVFNGISPNDDGSNDSWKIIGIEQFPENTVRVFNRWGNQVFERQGYRNDSSWDGTWNDQALPDGTYYYIIDLGNGLERINGYLQISR